MDDTYSVMRFVKSEGKTTDPPMNSLTVSVIWREGVGLGSLHSNQSRKGGVS